MTQTHRKHDSSKSGAVSGLLMAVVSVFALSAALVGLTLNQSMTSRTEASIGQTRMALLENSYRVEKVNDRKIEITGQFCYLQDLSSGGTENWTVFASESGGSSAGGGTPDGGAISVGHGFPAPCSFTDKSKGIASFGNDREGQRFSVELEFDSALNASNCPDVYLHYRGQWMSGSPFAKLTLSEFDDICGTADNGAQATPAPSTAPSTGPTAPASDTTVSGRISVYSCSKPDFTTLVFCDGDTCTDSGDPTTGRNSLKSSGTTPVEHGIWLDDTTEENTWIYRYSIAKDPSGTNLAAGKTYTFKGAQGWFSGTFFWSESEDLAKLSVTRGTTRDFEVHGLRTCDCPFSSVAYVKDVNGNYLTEFDNKLATFGISNSLQKFDRGDKPAVAFTNGRIEFNTTKLDLSYGYDALATMKLYAPGWRVVRQECVSKNPEVASCPFYTESMNKRTIDLMHPYLFEGVRVACGTDVEYGWILEKAPSPTPTPAGSGSGEASDGREGVGDIEVHTVFSKRQEDPESCSPEYIQGRNIQIDPQGADWTLFDWYYYEEIPVTVSGATTRNEPDSKTSGHQRFNNVPVGTYTVNVELDDNRMKYMQLATNCSRTIQVEAGKTNKVKLVYYVKPRYRFKLGDEVGNTCANCRNYQGSHCGPALGGKSRVICIDPGTYEAPGGGESDTGGGDPGGGNSSPGGESGSRTAPGGGGSDTGGGDPGGGNAPSDGDNTGGDAPGGESSVSPTPSVSPKSGNGNNAELTNSLLCDVDRIGGGLCNRKNSYLKYEEIDHKKDVRNYKCCPNINLAPTGITYKDVIKANNVLCDDNNCECEVAENEKPYLYDVTYKFARYIEGRQTSSLEMGCVYDINDNACRVEDLDRECIETEVSNPDPDRETCEFNGKYYLCCKNNGHLIYKKGWPQSTRGDSYECVTDCKDLAGITNTGNQCVRFKTGLQTEASACYFKRGDKYNLNNLITNTIVDKMPAKCCNDGKVLYNYSNGLGCKAPTPASSFNLVAHLSSLDLDGNGTVNSLDLLLVIESYGLEGEELASQTLSAGGDADKDTPASTPDFNGDGIVNAVDLSAILESYGTDVK